MWKGPSQAANGPTGPDCKDLIFTKIARLGTSDVSPDLKRPVEG